MDGALDGLEIVPGAKGYEVVPELQRAVTEFRKKYPDNDLLRLLGDTIALKTDKQYDVFLACEVAVAAARKKRKRMINADAK